MSIPEEHWTNGSHLKEEWHRLALAICGQTGLGVTIDRLFQETQQLLVCSGVLRCSTLPFHRENFQRNQPCVPQPYNRNYSLFHKYRSWTDGLVLLCCVVFVVRQLGETFNGRRLLPESLPSQRSSQVSLAAQYKQTKGIPLSSDSAIVRFVWKQCFFPKGNYGLLLMQPNVTFTFQ